MRRIKIDDDLKKNCEKFCKSLFQREDKKLEQIIPRLRKLQKKLRPRKHIKYIEYLELLIVNYNDIIRATPTQMKEWVVKFEAILPVGLLTVKIPNRKKFFHEEIVQIMRYSDLQEEEFPNYLKKTQNRACVYCNAQLCIVVERKFKDKKSGKSVTKFIPRFEIDHYYPKSKYPYFSTSFFNLYPCCGNCNRIKNDKQALFQLYIESDELDVFRFWIDDKVIIDYFTTTDNTVIKVWLETIDGDLGLLENHNNMFMVQSIADKHIDIVEELLIKSKLYTNAYKSDLVKNLGNIFPDTTVIEKLIIGNYTNSSDIHKRPMAKLTQDIARQLKIID